MDYLRYCQSFEHACWVFCTHYLLDTKVATFANLCGALKLHIRNYRKNKLGSKFVSKEWEPREQIALNAGPQSWEASLYLDSKNQGANCSQC